MNHDREGGPQSLDGIIGLHHQVLVLQAQEMQLGQGVDGINGDTDQEPSQSPPATPGLCLADSLSNHMLFVSPGLGKMMERHPDSLLNRPWLKLLCSGYESMPGDDHQPWCSSPTAVVLATEPARVAVLTLGKTRWRGSEVLALVFRLTVDRGLVRQALLSAQKRLAWALATHQQALAIIDAQATIVEVNPAWIGLAGGRPEQYLGKKISGVGLGDEQDSQALLKQTPHPGMSYDRLVYWYSGAAVRPCLVAAVAGPPDTGHHLIEVREVAKPRGLDEQYLRAQKLQAVGRLAGGMVHDFNNILTGIVGFADLTLESLEANSPLRADIMEIRAAGDRAAALTRQILTFSRDRQMNVQVLDLNQLISNSRRMLSRIIGEDVEFVFVPGDHLGQVKADAGQLEQVLFNLAANARDAMPQGGTLVMETYNFTGSPPQGALTNPRCARGVVLAVSDTGCGMDARVLRHLFEPFFTTKEAGKGTGLGLSTVREIVRCAEGQVDVDSQPGKGTTFRIFLPRVDQVVADLPASIRAPQMLPRGTETVLLVEDETLVRGLTHRILKRNGYRVIEAANAGEALLIFRELGTPVHLLLTDVVLPRMNGRLLFEQLKKISPDLKVLFMSGYNENVTGRHGVTPQGIPFLHKPFGAESLLGLVRRALDA